ncbi:hypothetical protein DFJ73DRAFT_845590 [Zopfochytrium polystomum]|nr:hypothetical protein DFJ73DRAFT_845590 [Zopfochytrium polystomum]
MTGGLLTVFGTLTETAVGVGESTLEDSVCVAVSIASGLYFQRRGVDKSLVECLGAVVLVVGEDSEGIAFFLNFFLFVSFLFFFFELFLFESGNPEPVGRATRDPLCLSWEDRGCLFACFGPCRAVGKSPPIAHTTSTHSLAISVKAVSKSLVAEQLPHPDN